MSHISFLPTRPIEDISSLLKSEPNIVVVEWFIGEEGLKAPSLKVHSAIKGIPNVHYCLYDLTAWTPFRSNKRDLMCEHPLVGEINTTFPSTIRAVSSCTFFTWIKTNPQLTHRILSDPRLYQVSSTFPPTGISLASLGLPDPLSIGDAGKAYSAYQYLEFIFLVEYLTQFVTRSEDYRLVFVLPNYEDKYYRVRPELESDLQPFRWRGITFATFSYGTKPFHRPYSGNNKVTKALKLGDL